jgi:hypothetical protein
LSATKDSDAALKSKKAAVVETVTFDLSIPTTRPCESAAALSSLYIAAYKSNASAAALCRNPTLILSRVAFSARATKNPTVLLVSDVNAARSSPSVAPNEV